MMRSDAATLHPMMEVPTAQVSPDAVKTHVASIPHVHRSVSSSCQDRTNARFAMASPRWRDMARAPQARATGESALGRRVCCKE